MHVKAFGKRFKGQTQVFKAIADDPFLIAPNLYVVNEVTGKRERVKITDYLPEQLRLKKKWQFN